MNETLFTNKDLAKQLKLKIGDVIKLDDVEYTLSDAYDLRDMRGFTYKLYMLVNHTFEIVKRKKFVGELTPLDVCARRYGLTILYDYTMSQGSRYTIYTYYEILKFWNANNHDDEIYNILKSRLDKEIEEVSDREVNE